MLPDKMDGMKIVTVAFTSYIPLLKGPHKHTSTRNWEIMINRFSSEILLIVCVGISRLPYVQ